MFKDKLSMACRHSAVCASVIAALGVATLTGCEKKVSEKSVIDVVREDFYSSMGTVEGAGNVKFLDARVDSAFAPYDEARLYELVAQVGELNAELRGVEPAFLLDSTEVEKLSKNTAHMAAGEIDGFMERQRKYAATKKSVDSLRTMIEQQTREVAMIMNTHRGMCGYKVTATVNDEAGREETLVFLTDKDGKKVLLKMREADFEDMKRRMSEGMTK